MKLLFTIIMLVVGHVAISQTITGSGTTNYIPRFTATSTQGNSLIFDYGTNVGIGTTTPSKALEIVTPNNAGPNYASRLSNAGNGYLIGRDGTTGVLNFYGDQAGANGYIFSGANGERMRIATNGYVGIGTPTPDGPLHIYKSNSTVVGGQLILDNIGNAAGDATSIILADYAGTASRGGNRAEIRSTVEASPYYGNLQLFTGLGASLTERIRITGAGNLRIGTSTPQVKRDVNGSIYCNSKIFIGTPDANTSARITNYALAVNGAAIFTKAKVSLYETPWADYVFNTNYPLRSLPEVEKFIKENKHLPDVPTTTEVEKDGLDLGGNQAILLEKIEELTLYIIEQNKKLNNRIKGSGNLKKYS